MDFALSEEQVSLDQAVRDLLADRFDLRAVREVVDDPAGDGDPQQLWKELAEQGWLAVLVPEEHDGLGLGLLDAAVIARRAGAACLPGPYTATVVAGEAIRLAGSAEQQLQWLPKVAAGDVRLALAAHRAGGGWDAAGVGVQVADGALSGRAVQVEYAHVADRLVVAAHEDGGISLWLVDPTAAGMSLHRVQALDGTTRLADVELAGASGERLAGGAVQVLDEVLARATVLAANDLVGIAREALRRTVDYDTTREQFGRPVGSFQALKHRLADLHVAVTMAEHGGWYAAHARDAGLADAGLALSVAKAKASDVAREVTAWMIQYHGGIGYTWEHDAHLFFKRAKRLEYAYGDAGTHRERIARLVVDRSAAS